MTAKSNPSNQPAKDQSLTTNQGNTIPVLGLGSMEII
jgi:hypothetical protein